MGREKYGEREEKQLVSQGIPHYESNMVEAALWHGYSMSLELTDTIIYRTHCDAHFHSQLLLLDKSDVFMHIFVIFLSVCDSLVAKKKVFCTFHSSVIVVYEARLKLLLL